MVQSGTIKMTPQKVWLFIVLRRTTFRSVLCTDFRGNEIHDAGIIPGRNTDVDIPIEKDSDILKTSKMGVVASIKLRIMNSIFMILICTLSNIGCCNNILVVEHEGLSRTYINIKFRKLMGRYVSKREVGGEHVDEYYFMVPTDSTCEISISSIEGNVSAYLSDSGGSIWTTSGNTLKAQRYKIVGPAIGRFEFDVMAHPVDHYTFQIHLTKKGP